MGSFFTGKVAVVTGAASGIGRALAVELGRRGAHVAISDVDTDGLAGTETLVRETGAQVRADHVDVKERERVDAYAQEVLDHFGRVDVVINNAGIAYTGEVAEMAHKDLERVMDVDFWGVVHGSTAFLDALAASGDGRLVNISSIFGLFSMPSQSAYNAAKFAVRGFTESLRQEMELSDKPITVTCVHPGGIDTNIARNAGQAEGRDHDQLAASFDKLARTSPEKAAKVILRGIEKRKAKVLIGADAHVLDVTVRVLGSKYQTVFAKVARRQGL